MTVVEAAGLDGYFMALAQVEYTDLSGIDETASSNHERRKKPSRVSRFMMAPLWLIYAVSGDALKLYCLIGARYSTMEGNRAVGAFPSRVQLKEEMGCSVDKIDRLIAELANFGALTKKPRYTAAGDRTSNEYILYTEPRAAVPTQPGDRTDAPSLSRTDAVTWPLRCGGNPNPVTHTQSDPSEEEEEEEEIDSSGLRAGRKSSSVVHIRQIPSLGPECANSDDGTELVRDSGPDPFERAQPFSCGCKADSDFLCECIGCKRCRQNAAHKKPRQTSAWRKKQECLVALGFEPNEISHLSAQYADSYLRRRYRWVVKKGKKVTYPKKYFSISLDMEIVHVEITEWEWANGYGFPSDVHWTDGMELIQ